LKIRPVVVVVVVVVVVIVVVVVVVVWMGLISRESTHGKHSIGNAAYQILFSSDYGWMMGGVVGILILAVNESLPP